MNTTRQDNKNNMNTKKQYTRVGWLYFFDDRDFRINLFYNQRQNYLHNCFQCFSEPLFIFRIRTLVSDLESCTSTPIQQKNLLFMHCSCTMFCFCKWIFLGFWHSMLHVLKRFDTYSRTLCTHLEMKKTSQRGTKKVSSFLQNFVLKKIFCYGLPALKSRTVFV